jgi:hypothetical protein
MLIIETYQENEEIQKAIKENLISNPVIRENTHKGILELGPIRFVNQGNLARMERAKKLITDKRSNV